jgi:hypothetical protein
MEKTTGPFQRQFYRIAPEELKVICFKWFMLGFQESGEGYNAEYPFELYPDRKMQDELREKFNEFAKVQDNELFLTK